MFLLGWPGIDIFEGVCNHICIASQLPVPCPRGLYSKGTFLTSFTACAIPPHGCVFDLFLCLCSFIATHQTDGTFSNLMQVYHSQTLISLEKKRFAQLVVNGGFSYMQRASTFEVEFDMPQDILCMPDAEAKARLEQLLLEGMQKAADVERVIVTSIRVPEESKLVCGRRLQRMSRSLKSSHDAIIEVLTVRGLRCCCVLTNDAMHHITLTFSWNTDACRISVSHKHGCQ